MPDVLYEQVVEVEERVVLCSDSCQLNLTLPAYAGSTGEKVMMQQKLMWVICTLRP